MGMSRREKKNQQQKNSVCAQCVESTITERRRREGSCLVSGWFLFFFLIQITIHVRPCHPASPVLANAGNNFGTPVCGFFDNLVYTIIWLFSSNRNDYIY